MRLTEPLILRGRIMLAGSTILTATDICSLRMRFPKNSFRIGDPVLDAVVDFEDDSHEREVARTAQQKISECMSKVHGRFSSHASLDGVSVSAIQSAVGEVVKYLEDNPVSAALLDSFMTDEGYLSEHAGNVFYLSMLLGAARRDYVAKERRRQSFARNLTRHVTDNLAPLGLGAMLADLGMLPLNHVFAGDTPLTPEIWREIGDHPNVGAELLPEGFSAAARMIVRTHHENLDGSGYPEGLSGDKLHVFTRIVRIADAYNAATATRVYKEAKSPVRVLWEMSVGSYRRFYDPILMRTFARLIQPFPIGSKIRLHDRRSAVVIQYNRDNPVAPQVIVAFDRKGERLPESELEGPLYLGEHPAVRAGAFGDEDLSFIYEDGQDGGKRSRVGVWPSLFAAAFP